MNERDFSHADIDSVNISSLWLFSWAWSETLSQSNLEIFKSAISQEQHSRCDFLHVETDWKKIKVDFKNFNFMVKKAPGQPDCIILEPNTSQVKSN